MLKAQDIMTRNVISVTPETRIDDLARLFVEKRVSAMPVITKEGRLMGVVSETDLVEQNKPLHVPTVISLFDWVLYLESEKDFQEEVEQITARSSMDRSQAYMMCSLVGDLRVTQVVDGNKGVHMMYAKRYL